MIYQLKKLLTKIKTFLFIGSARFLLRKDYEATFIWCILMNNVHHKHDAFLDMYFLGIDSD